MTDDTVKTASSGQFDGLTLYTIGHSNLTFDDFVALLNSHNIRVLVDVRSAPVSKFAPHFNKNMLQQTLPAVQIEYRYAGDFLGGRPADPELYKQHNVPTHDTKREDFLELVDYAAVMQSEKYLKGLKGLLQLIRQQPTPDSHVAIMCSEGNPHECHRHHLITRSLIDPKVIPAVVTDSVQVYHILKDHTLEAVTAEQFKLRPQQLPLF